MQGHPTALPVAGLIIRWAEVPLASATGGIFLIRCSVRGAAWRPTGERRSAQHRSRRSETEDRNGNQPALGMGCWFAAER